MDLYSAAVDRYSRMEQTGLILPDNVMRREGIACGDELELSGEINNGIVKFHIKSRGCRLSKAACNYLYDRFFGSSIEDAVKECSQLCAKIEEDPDGYLAFWGVQGKRTLLDCLSSPVFVLRDFFRTMLTAPEASYERQDTLKNLDCDACVNAARINWTGKEDLIKPAEAHKKYDTGYRRKWGTLAKLVLSPAEQELLRRSYPEMTEDDFDYLTHEKMLWTVYANYEKYGVDFGRDSRFKEFVYSLHRQYVVKREIAEIKQHIQSVGLNAYFVKGACSCSLYDPKQYRLHLDYDIVCLSENDAFMLGSFLYTRGFRLFSGVFSLKWIDEPGGKTCSGHFHLQKVLNAQYRIIVDITFPAFPMGRIALFHPGVRGGGIRTEDLLLVAICHTFKHRNVFMKDVNDVYLMLTRESIDFAYLEKRLAECGLKKETAVLLRFIYENYDIPADRQESISAQLLLPALAADEYRDWPYSEETVFSVKRDDLDTRLKSSHDYPRTYLFPIAITQSPIAVEQVERAAEYERSITVEKYSDAIRRVIAFGIEFYLLPMGIFMDSDYNVARVGREAVRSAAESILQLVDAHSVYELPYAIRLRDNWYD